MRKIILGLMFIFFLSSVHTTEGQSRFRAGLLGGLTASQVNGDDISGYGLIGLTGGLRVDTRLNDILSVKLDLVYSHKGSNGFTGPFQNGPKVEIKMNTIDIPVSFVIKDWYNDLGGGESYYRLHFELGLTYYRLISATTLGFDNVPIEDFFAENQLEVHYGITFMFNRNWGINIRHQNALTGLIPREDRLENSVKNNMKLLYFSGRVLYMF